MRVTGNGRKYWRFLFGAEAGWRFSDKDGGKQDTAVSRLCRLRPGCWDCFEICSALFGHINFVHFQPPCPAWGAREDGRAEHDITYYVFLEKNVQGKTPSEYPSIYLSVTLNMTQLSIVISHSHNFPTYEIDTYST